MSVSRHDQQPAGEIHIVYNWSYADAATRGAAVGFVAGDVGKLARQEDNNTLWMLIDDSPVTWVQVGGVPGTGDVTGPGSATDNAVVRFDGTGGKTVQNSLATVDDSGGVNIPTGQTYNINGSPHTHTGLVPGAHATEHENGGGDEISVAGLSGELADPQKGKTISISFTADGSAYFVANEAMTIGSTTYEGGTGTLSYEKALAGATTSFSADPLPVDLAQGDVLKVTVASLSGYKSVTLVRTA